MLGVLAQKFDWFQTFRNNFQQHATGCANGRNISNTQHGGSQWGLKGRIGVKGPKI